MKRFLALVACFALVACLALPMFAEDQPVEFVASNMMQTVTLPSYLENEASFSVVGTKGSNSSVTLTLKSECHGYLQLIGIYFDDPSGFVNLSAQSSGVTISASSLPVYIPCSISDDDSTFPGRFKNLCSLKITYNSATTYKLVFTISDVEKLDFGTQSTLNVVTTSGMYFNTSYDLQPGEVLTFNNIVGGDLRYFFTSVYDDEESTPGILQNSTLTNGDSITGTDEVNGELWVYFTNSETYPNQFGNFSFRVKLTEASDDPIVPPEFEEGEGVFSIVGNFFTLVLSVGSSLITWATTGTNFIVLIPLVLFILVAAILFIRKLVKGV